MPSVEGLSSFYCFWQYHFIVNHFAVITNYFDDIKFIGVALFWFILM